MYRILVLIFSLLLYLFSGKIYAASLYDTVQKGNKLYQDGKFDKALKTYVDGQIEHADDPNLKYNIASSYYKTKNYAEAVKGYLDVAATAKDVQLQEKALYNCGNALFRQGKLEESIEYYKKALEIDPNDQDAKHNLEFAREELKRRINEAKETEKKQQEQKQHKENQQNKDQQQNQSQQQGQHKQPEEKQQQPQQQPQGQKQEEQQEATQQEQKEQQARAGEQKPDEQQPAQGQSGSPENKQGEKSGKVKAIPQPARPMTKEEADQWLNSIEENRAKFAKKKARESVSGQYRPEKDW